MQRSNGKVWCSFWGSLLSLVILVNVCAASTRVIPPLRRDYSLNELRESPFQFEYNVIAPRADGDYRLPNQTEPIHYDVEIWTNVHAEDLYFNGTVSIQLTVIENTNEIVLHHRQLTILSVTIKNDLGTTTEELSFSYEEELEFLTLTVNNGGQVLPQNSNWTLTIVYEGLLREDNGGFYVSKYTDSEDNTRFLATTQFESTDARHGFPCFDEPAKRATFTISIKHDPSYAAISNMPVNESQSSSGFTVFQTTPNMPTYLIAYIVSDFVSTEGVMNSLPQRVFSRPGTEGDQEWALVSGMLIIQRLAEYFGIPYAEPKLDQVAVPDFAAGAMENWGLVTYREEYLLYNTENSTTNTQTNIANIIAHEYAHQWFGNLVAIRWWTYLWLKESFATLFSYEAADDAYPEWDIYQLFHAGEYQSALVNDGSNTPRPMTHYVQTPSEISRLYDTISYNKGGSVLHMFKNALTDTVFKRGLHNYLTNNQYSAADEEQLFDAIQTAAKEEDYALPYTISAMLSTWTRQGGVPLLDVTRNYDDGSFTVKQSQFFNDDSQTSSLTWIIPFNYVNQSNGDFRNTEATHYLSDAEIKVEAGLSRDDWLLLNKQSTGYYRINYDEENWNLIINALLETPYKIDTRNRAQLLHDVYRLSVTKGLSQDIMLRLLTYLSGEEQYAPWSTGNAILTTFNRYLRGDQDYEDFKFYISELVRIPFDKLGVNDISGEQHLRKFTRTILINLACLAGIESCIEGTNNKLKDSIYNDVPIEPNLQSATYCNGLRQSGDAEFNYIYDLMLTTENQAQRRVMISALGCSESETQITKFISSSIDTTNSLRTQDRTTLLSSAYSRSSVGLLASIDFLDTNWQAYAELTSDFGGSNPLDADIRSMSQYVVNDEQNEKLTALVDKVKSSSYVTTTLEATVQLNVASNFDWLSKNRNPLMGWFYTYRNSSPTITLSLTTFIIALTFSVFKLL